MEKVQVGIVGHSFVRRLANYALLRRSMNLNLDHERFEVTFVARGGLKVQQLYTLTHDIVNASSWADCGGQQSPVRDTPPHRDAHHYIPGGQHGRVCLHV